jgi:hypothetical protein
MGISRSGSTAALIAALVVGASVPADNVAWSALTGASIRGRVISPGASVGGALKVTTDEKVCGLSVADDAIVADRQGHVAHAVVTIKGLPWSGAPIGPHIVNKGCRFVPHVSVARPGATLEVTSEDPTLHTTHLYASDKRSLFNIALPMPGIVIKRPLEKTPGVLRVACDTHPWMQGFIAVTADRSAVTGSDGGFEIPDVPPGSHEIAVWHEVLQAPPQKVVVTAGQTTEVTITLVKR